MPLITVEGPKTEVEQKRELVKKLTDAAVDIYGIAREHIIVLIRENAPENVGVGGELLVDRTAD
jgi:4-oxalocrotonate tautomerase